MRQGTLAEAGFQRYRKRTRRELFCRKWSGWFPGKRFRHG